MSVYHSKSEETIEGRCLSNVNGILVDVTHLGLNENSTSVAAGAARPKVERQARRINPTPTFILMFFIVEVEIVTVESQHEAHLRVRAATYKTRL